MRHLALALLCSGCWSWGVTVRMPARHCGRLDPDAVAAFHRSHDLSVTANESSVEGLAVGDDDGDAGTGWQVCVEGGVATIQNHPTAQDCEAPELHPGCDGGRP